MKFPQLKFRGWLRGWLAIGAAVCAFSFAGCGGGGSGGGSSSGPVTPPTNPTTNVTVTVQLSDNRGAPVEGLVTLNTQPNAQRRATRGGIATFANVPRGALTASAEVNGVVKNQNFVATSGANPVQISIDPNTPTPGGTTPPAPPF